MPEPVVKFLDSTIGETGPTQTFKYADLDHDKPTRIVPSIGSGDTVIVEGKLEAADNFQTLATFTANVPQDVYLMRYWRGRRTVDGGSADSWLKAQNVHNQPITAHT